MKNLDCRGLACPGSVIQVKKTLEETPIGGSFSIDLDSDVSRDNVLRFARSRGAGVEVMKETAEGIRLVITAPTTGDTKARRSAAANASRPAMADKHEDTADKQSVVLITADTLGSGDDKLGQILMEGFINTLPEQERVPDRILFLNAGVKLAVQGSTVKDALVKLNDLGCEILVCGTCLEFFSLKDKLAAGTVSNMFDIQRALLEADTVIKI